MTGIEIFQIIATSGLLIGGLNMFIRIGRILEKVDNIEGKIDKLEIGQSDLSNRVTRLEVRVEERTLKIVHVQKTGTQKDD